MASTPRPFVPLLLGCVLFVAPSSAGAGAPSFGANDLETLFFVAKSDDKNRVDYGMRLDKHCAPVGDEPVFPYWREFEPPPPVRTKPMSGFSKMGYGISTQKVLKRSAAGSSTRSSSSRSTAGSPSQPRRARTDVAWRRYG